MLTAAINSATQETSVALISEGKLIGEKTWVSNRNEAEKILPGIAQLLKKTKKRWKDVGRLFVVTGPGPFTGLRVGVTIANALAFSADCPIKTADVFQYLKERVPAKIRSKTAIVVRGGGEYVALLSEGNTKEKLLKIQNLPAALQKSSTQYILAEMKTREVAELKTLLKSAGKAVKFLVKRELISFGTATVELMNRSRKSSKIAQPLYLQKPHITQSKKPNFI